MCAHTQQLGKQKFGMEYRTCMHFMPMYVVYTFVLPFFYAYMYIILCLYTWYTCITYVYAHIIYYALRTHLLLFVHT
jgi:hypothetical protein